MDGKDLYLVKYSLYCISNSSILLQNKISKPQNTSKSGRKGL